MAVTLAADVLARYRRFSLFNSPYVAHDDGRAIDLYPPAGAETVPSPVAGEVLETRTVTAPPQPYAADEDHLVLVETADGVARLLHVDPALEAGETVAVGDGLGEPVRAGFFAPWVPNHLHLEFREAAANPYRATGSVPITVEAAVQPLPWDGTGTVVETGRTWARLDAPTHPAPGERFVGLAATGPDGEPVGVLDGGLVHYDGGGLLGAGRRAPPDGGVHLAGARVGTAEGRRVAWADVTVRANGAAVTGIACHAARDRAGVKLVGRDLGLAVGERVAVAVDPAGG